MLFASLLLAISCHPPQQKKLRDLGLDMKRARLSWERHCPSRNVLLTGK
jgi:hypothetical protein